MKLSISVIALSLTATLSSALQPPSNEVEARADTKPIFTCPDTLGQRKFAACCDVVGPGAGDLPTNAGVGCIAQPAAGCPLDTTRVCCLVIVRAPFPEIILGKCLLTGFIGSAG